MVIKLFDYIALKARFYMALDESGALGGEAGVSAEKVENAWNLFKKDIEKARMNDLDDLGRAAPKRARCVLSLVSLFLSVTALLLVLGR